MSVLPLERRLASLLNIALLLLVALVPCLLNSVEITSSSLSTAQISSLRDYSSSLFVLDLTGMLVILATFAHLIGVGEKSLTSPEIAKAFRSGRNTMIVLTLLMLITIAPPFWQVTFLGAPLRLYFWYVLLAAYWAGRLVRPSSRIWAAATASGAERRARPSGVPPA